MCGFVTPGGLRASRDGMCALPYGSDSSFNWYWVLRRGRPVGQLRGSCFITFAL